MDRTELYRVSTQILENIINDEKNDNNILFDMDIWDWSQGVALYGIWKYYMSFVPDADNEAIHAMVKSLDVFEEGPSWGGFESVVNTPGLNPNREMLQFEGIPQGLVRISVGLEDADTLIEDLDRALNTLPR